MEDHQHSHDHHCCEHNHNHASEEAKVAKRPLSAMEQEPVIWFLSILTVLVSAIFLFSLSDNPEVNNFTIYFLSIVLEAFPFLLIGAFVSGTIEVFVSQDRIASMMKNKFLAVPIAAGLGLIFPVCECAIVPVVRRLVKKGVPFSCAIAYMLSSPTVNPLVTLSTGMAFAWNWYYVLGRFFCGLVIAIVGGYALGMIVRKVAFNKNIDSDTHSCNHGFCLSNELSSTWKRKLNAIIGHATNDFFDVAKYLLLGSFIAAMLKAFINWEALMTFTTNQYASPLPMMLLAFIMNLCSEADAFVAAAFTDFPFHAKMAFLLLGPMLDVKLITMYSLVYSKRAILAILIVVPILVFIVSLLLYELTQATGVVL